tara:strand:- start:310 stop:459 length:150 start_codon:yes stop_codon:yes gene_type:complete
MVNAHSEVKGMPAVASIIKIDDIQTLSIFQNIVQVHIRMDHPEAIFVLG